MRVRSTLLAATVLAVPFAAKAQPVTGLYVGAGAGVNFRQNQNIQGLEVVNGPGTGAIFGSGLGGVPAGVTTGLQKQYNPGFVGVGSIGWGFGNGLRAEIEGNYRTNRVSKVTGTPFPTAAGGNENTAGVMANVLYDFDIAKWTGGQPVIFPYLGVGAGYAWTSYSGVKNYGTNFPYFMQQHNTAGNFAYQAIAGLSYPLAAVPGLSLTAEYRFFGVLDGGEYTGSIDTLAGRSFIKTSAGNQYNHSILLGVRYAFNAAPPPPPPAPVVAPAPAPARSYLVFFDWDKYNLTDRARQIIAEAAQNSTRVQYTRIQVNGYTDTSGTPQYNMGLSVRRANAVAAELVRNGVPKSAISIQGFGETHLLVPTGDQVREPQNRRVEIVIQ